MNYKSYGLSCIILFLTFNIIIAQQSIEDFVREGIEYHDGGEYDKAIKIYKKALDIDSKSTLVNYEIALSYFTKGDYKKAIKYSDKVIDEDKEFMIEAYMTKGNSLDMLGKTKKSIKLFEKAIKETEGHYLLHYNLALNHFNLNNLDSAEQCALDALVMNPNHSSSHLILANVHNQQGNSVQTLLAAYYFLFLEPNTSRSPLILSLLEENFSKNVTRDKEKDNTQYLIINDGDDSEFSTAELMLTLIAASNFTEENEGKSKDQIFVGNTESFFKYMGESKGESNNGIWWDFYTDFYYDIANSDHLETYCKYITQSKEESDKWLKENESKLASFDNWLQGN